MGALLCQPVGGLRTCPDLSDPHMESTMQAKGDMNACHMPAGMASEHFIVGRRHIGKAKGPWDVPAELRIPTTCMLHITAM